MVITINIKWKNNAKGGLIPPLCNNVTNKSFPDLPSRNNTDQFVIDNSSIADNYNVLYKYSAW